MISSRTYFLLIIPAIVLLFILVIYPMTKVFEISLYTREIGGSYSEILTLNNYIHFFKQPVYCSILFRTLKIAFIVTLFCFFLGYPIAHFISKIEKRMGFFLLAPIILSLLVNELIRSYAWIILLQKTGLINHSLLTFGILSEPLHLLENEFGVVICMVNILLPLMILPILYNLIIIDKNLIFAAKGLGANAFQVFYKITLPLSIPGIITGSLLVFLNALGLYISPSLLGGPKVMVMSTLISQQTLNILNWPFASALSFIVLTVVFITILVFRKIIKYDMFIMGR